MIRASAPIPAARKTAAVKAPALKASAVKAKGSAATALVNPTSTTTLGRTSTPVNSLVYPNGRGSSASNSNLANSLVYPNGVPYQPSNSSSSSSWLPILGIGAVAGIALLAMFGGKLFGGGNSSGDQPTDWSSTPAGGGGETSPPPPQDLSSNDNETDQKVADASSGSAASQPSDVLKNAAASADDSEPAIMNDAKSAEGSRKAGDDKDQKTAKQDQPADEQKSDDKKPQEKKKKIATHVKTCGRDLASYNRDANLSGNLAELLQNNDLKDGSSYTWRTSKDPVNMRVHNGNIQIYVSKFSEWDTIRQICSDGDNTSLKFKANKDSYDIQIDIKKNGKNGNQFVAETFLMGSSPMSLGTATIGANSLSVDGGRQVASQSHGGLQ